MAKGKDKNEGKERKGSKKLAAMSLKEKRAAKSAKKRAKNNDASLI
jgi:hypothetical protein